MMDDWPEFREDQIVWPDESEEWANWTARPEGWDIGLGIQNRILVSVILYNPDSTKSWRWELDDCVEALAPDTLISTNQMIAGGDDALNQCLAYQLAVGATLTVHKKDGQWEIQLDTNVGYCSQVMVERFPWEDEG